MLFAGGSKVKMKWRNEWWYGKVLHKSVVDSGAGAGSSKSNYTTIISDEVDSER